MQAFLRENSWSVAASVLLHGLLAVALVLTAVLSGRRPPAAVQPLPIDAVVVSSQVLHAARQARAERLEQERARARVAAEAQAAALQAERDAAAQAEQQAAEAARAAAAAQAEQAQQAAAARRLADAKQAADARRAEEAKQAAQAQRAAEAQKAVEAQRAAEAQKAAEAKRAADAKRAAEAKRAADDRARQEREAELRRQLSDEEHVNAVESGPLRDQYVAQLRARIQHAWIKPPSARAGIDCLVEVTQVRGGEVTAVRVTQCNGDEAVRQSIQNAVYRASPLPDPPDPALFERVFQLRFKPDE